MVPKALRCEVISQCDGNLGGFGSLSRIAPDRKHKGNRNKVPHYESPRPQ